MEITWDKQFKPHLAADVFDGEVTVKNYVMVEQHEEDGAGCMVALNGFILSVTPCQVKDGRTGDTFAEVLLPSDVVAQAGQVKGKDPAKVVIENVDGKPVASAMVNGARYSRILGDGRWPKWRKLVPSEFERPNGLAIDLKLYGILCRALGVPGGMPAPVFHGKSGADPAYVVVGREPGCLGVIMALHVDFEAVMDKFKATSKAYAMDSTRALGST